MGDGRAPNKTVPTDRSVAEFLDAVPDERRRAEAWTVREQVDAARERTVAEAYREVGVPADVAAMLGRLSVAVLIGAQHRGAETDRAALLDLYRHLQEMTVATYLPDGASTSKKVPPDLPTDR